jgi:hypothetical protein
MSHASRRRIREDLELIERFAHTYRERFNSLIAELNTAPTPDTASVGLRLCVEALNMVLHTQDSLAFALRELAIADQAGAKICTR